MAASQTAATRSRPAPRLLERYRKELAPALAKQFDRTNVLAAPQLEKIVVNIGCGEAAHEAKVLEAAQRDLALITGQRPMVTRAKRAISNFKIKEQDPVGCKVTLRRARMYEFLDRLVHVALPRIRDFRGLNPGGFDQGGNYSFGIREHTIFPEIQPDQAPYPLGMDITLVTTARTREEAFALLKGFDLPLAAK
ncbi:MAG: 50S ribosomal protein L5 [Candidatus Omnitrophica bacterium]|nr:50S ribosomal protein L5 [Candidatus Omnitrophota bacterium]